MSKHIAALLIILCATQGLKTEPLKPRFLGDIQTCAQDEVSFIERVAIVAIIQVDQCLQGVIDVVLGVADAVQTIKDEINQVPDDAAGVINTCEEAGSTFQVIACVGNGINVVNTDIDVVSQQVQNILDLIGNQLPDALPDVQPCLDGVVDTLKQGAAQILVDIGSCLLE